MKDLKMLNVADASRVMSYLWSVLRGKRLALVGVLLIFLLEAATALVVPLIIGRIVDLLNQSESQAIPSSFGLMVAAVIGAALAAGLFAWLGGVGIARIVETTIAQIREDYVTAALKLPRATVETAGTGDVVTRASDDIAQVSGTLPDVLPRLFISVFTIVLIAGTITTIDWRFLLIFVAVIPLYIMTVRWYLKTAPPVYEKQRAVESVRSQNILGTLDNLDTVRAHQLGQHQLDRVAESSWHKVRWAMRTRIVQNRLFGRLNIAQGLGLIAILAMGVWLAFTGEVTPGAVTAAALLFQRIVGPIQALMYVMDDFQAALASLSRLVGVVDLPAHDEVKDKKSLSKTTDFVVKLENLSFAYPNGHRVLDGINLVIAPGETVAVVGATGSGKSTLASIIAGVYQPQEGHIARGVFANEIYSLSQETHVFMGTVRSNLLLDKPEATEQELIDALQATCATDFVEALPEGLDTVVGTRLGS